MREECINCHKKTVALLIERHGLNEKEAAVFRANYQLILDKNPDISNPYLATLVQRMAKEVLGVQDLYKSEKQQANQILMDNYRSLKKWVTSSSDPFKAAAKLSVAGNIIDYGAHSTPDDVLAAILELAEQPLTIDFLDKLKKDIEKAGRILYLGDNAGEIVLDKLFIETINHRNVTYVVRGKPVLNDATMYDALSIGLNNLCAVISNGHDAPSTLLEHCSSGFNYYFQKADVVIAKGMGNFEGLMNVNRPNLYFMLMAKCDPIANLLGVSKGDRLVKLKTEIYESV